MRLKYLWASFLASCCGTLDNDPGQRILRQAEELVAGPEVELKSFTCNDYSIHALTVGDPVYQGQDTWKIKSIPTCLNNAKAIRTPNEDRTSLLHPKAVASLKASHHLLDLYMGLPAKDADCTTAAETLDWIDVQGWEQVGAVLETESLAGDAQSYCLYKLRVPVDTFIGLPSLCDCGVHDEESCPLNYVLFYKATNAPTVNFPENANCRVWGDPHYKPFHGGRK